MKVFLLLILVIGLVFVIGAVIVSLQSAVSARCKRRANDPLFYLTRHERREYSRAIAKRKLSEADEAYYQRLNDMLTR